MLFATMKPKGRLRLAVVSVLGPLVTGVIDYPPMPKGRRREIVSSWPTATIEGMDPG